MIGLQMGSNKGATQAGQNFGKTRAIIDWLRRRSEGAKWFLIDSILIITI